MSDPRATQGSHAEVAEAGLNPEEAFAALTPATDRRLAAEAKAHAQQGEAAPLRPQGSAGQRQGITDVGPVPGPGR